MLQIVMQVSAASRITSYSISFQPASERSTSTWPMGETASPLLTTSMNCSSVPHSPPPVPPRVKAGRTTSGQPDLGEEARASASESHRRATSGAGSPMRLEQLLEPLPVLGGADRLQRGAQETDAVPLQHPGVLQRDREVEAGLAAQRRQQPVGTLRGDDPLQHRDGQRLDVDGVRRLVVGHDRRRVAVDQHHPDALLAERPARLGAGVVELGGLADDHRAGADDEHALRSLSPVGGRRGGAALRPRCPSALTGARRPWLGDLGGSRPAGGEEGEAPPARAKHALRQHRRAVAIGGGEGEELVEDLGAVLGAGGALRVVLDRDDGKGAVAQPLDAAVVEVALADAPAGCLSGGWRRRPGTRGSGR